MVTIEVDARAGSASGMMILSSEGRQRKVLKPGRDKPSGPLRYVWDGTDSEGRQVPAGVYLAVAKEAGARVKLLKLSN